MNSVFLLIHEKEGCNGAYYDNLISAHPTLQSAKNAERFFRGYDDRFSKIDYDYTRIEEIDFEA